MLQEKKKIKKIWEKIRKTVCTWFPSFAFNNMMFLFTTGLSCNHSDFSLNGLFFSCVYIHNIYFFKYGIEWLSCHLTRFKPTGAKLIPVELHLWSEGERFLVVILKFQTILPVHTVTKAKQVSRTKQIKFTRKHNIFPRTVAY